MSRRFFENFQKEFSKFFRENRPKRKKLEKTSEKKLSETAKNAYKRNKYNMQVKPNEKR
jgi:hypothetical protein